MRSYFLFLTLFSIFLISTPLISHEGQPHEEAGEEQKEPANQEKEILAKINQDYVRDIKPIFQVSCFDCHSTQTRYPWYHALPGAKKLIDDDITEAKKHLDMTNDFPFQGHGSPEKDLDAIQEVTEKKTMPPFRYRIMHWGSGLSKQEREKVLKWITESRQKINSNE